MMIVMIFIRNIIGLIWIIVRDPRGGRGQAHCVLQVQVIIVNMIMIMIIILTTTTFMFRLIIEINFRGPGGQGGRPLVPCRFRL